MPSQAPESAATTSASPLQSAIVDFFLLDAVIGYQPCLPRNHDPVPLTLSRSASPAQSESPHVSCEATGALFTASRLSVVGRTLMIPGLPRRYRKIDFSCPCWSHVHLHFKGLMRPVPSHSASQLGQSTTVFQQGARRLCIRLQASPSHPSHGIPSAVLVSS